MPRNRAVEKWRAHAARARERAAGLHDGESKRMQLAIAVRTTSGGTSGSPAALTDPTPAPDLLGGSARPTPLTMAAGCPATSPRSRCGRCRSWNSGTRSSVSGTSPRPGIDERLQVGVRLVLAAAFAPDEQRDVARPQRGPWRRQAVVGVGARDAT